MPSAAKLVAAIAFGALAYFVSGLIIPLLPEGTQTGMFAPINALIGILCGWIIVGARAGDGYNGAIGYGLTGMAALVFWGLLVHAIWEMLQRSLQRQYDGPVDAIIGVFELMIEYGRIMLDGAVIGTLVVGALLAAFLAEWVSRRAA